MTTKIVTETVLDDEELIELREYPTGLLIKELIEANSVDFTKALQFAISEEPSIH